MKANRFLYSGISLSLGLVAAFLLLIVVSGHASSIKPSTAQASQPGAGYSPLQGVDLDVTFINRSPLYKAYCVEYPWDVPGQPGIPFLCPGTENDRRWPETGEIVTFTAHIINKGTVASPAFGYAWQIDGVEVSNGTLPALAPAEEITTTYHWPWAHELSPDGQRALGDHTVGFVVDPTNAIPETHESNNSLEDHTNAISFRIYFTPEMYAVYNVPVNPQWPASAEDWLQKQIAMMNWDLANSTYPVAPQGAKVRVRINTIGVSPSMPPGDGEHDGGWILAGDDRPWMDPVTDIDWPLIHELSHQVSIIDLYQIQATVPDVRVRDRLGNPLNVEFSWPRSDLMGGGDIWPHTIGYLYSSHSAGGASTYQGYRNGYYGSYLFDIPLQNYFRLLDNQGNPAQGVQVALYQRSGPADWTGGQSVEDTPEISGTTDASGLFLLTNRSAHGGTVTANGHVLHDNPFGVVDIVGSQNLFLVQLRQGDHEEYHWLDITDLNLAYWMGDTISHTFTISSHVPLPEAPQAPVLTKVQAQGNWVRVCWQDSPSPGVTGYRVYRATRPMFEYELVAEVGSELCLEEIYAAGSNGGKVYAVTAVSSAGLESGFSNFGWAPTLSNPASLAITPQGERFILDPRNGYALILQDSGGVYRQFVGSVHFHLEYSQFMALDVQGRLLFSHPGDWYVDRHSVRVASLDATPLLEFGEQGSGPGQFENPTGVASWGEMCTYGGPYQVDEHTLLLLHLDGSYTGAQGEQGMVNGTSFEPGLYGQGVLVNESDVFTYTTASNWNLSQGTLEFWVRPNWNGADEQYHLLFEESSPGHSDNLIRLEAGGWLTFRLWDSTSGYEVVHKTDDWKAGEWHHIAVTWQDPRLSLYEDGNLVGTNVNGGVPDWLGGILSIGSNLEWSGYRADAVFDEIRISDVPRLGNSISCERILVADSGNHRIQAFDKQGNFVAEFGSHGSAPGQFDTPQGLAVNSSGRVIVVDGGNNRLQVLNFDGQTFAFVDSFTAGLNSPTGVAVTSRGDLVVADTGNNRLVVLDPQGNFLAEYDQPNDGYTGPFNAPRGVAVDQADNLVVADTGNARVVTVRTMKKIWLPLVSRSEGSR